MESFDICRDYTSILIENTVDYNIFSAFDEVTVFNEQDSVTQGEYYIDVDFCMANGTAKFSKGWYPTVLINYALENSYIAKSNIKYCVRASMYIKHDAFSKFAKDILTMFPDQEGSKPLVNCFIGQLNQQYVTKSKGCVTDDYNVAMGVLLNESEKKQSPKVYQVKDLYFIRSEYKEKKVSGNVPIYRHIIASSYIKIDKLYHHVCKKDTLVIAYNTDSIKVINPKQFTLKDEPYAGDIRREYEINIKGTFFDDLEMNNAFKYTPTKWNEIQENKENYNEIVDFVGKNSCMVVGMAGSGKTEIIKKI